MNKITSFNIRVYGLLINESNEVLLCDEYMMDRYMTKFPGGGLEFGEGPEDCILREARDEFGQEVIITGHFYTTGFFQQAEFFEDQQLISIYYTVQLESPPAFTLSEIPFDFPSPVNNSRSFRWASIYHTPEAELTFPVDRHVLGILKRKTGND